MTKLAKSLGLFALVCTAAVWAQVSHVSINKRMFDLGSNPKMRVNVITDNQDMTRLKFVLHQSSGEETLMAEQLNRFLLLLTGVEDVTDPKARLLIREYRVDRWYEVKNLSLFEDTGSGESSTGQANAAVVKPAKAPTMGTDLLTTQAPKSLSEPMLTTESKLTTEPKTNSATASNAGECRLDYRDETLWRLANRYAGDWQLSVYGAMLAIHDANPGAFSKNRINFLRKDAILTCPSSEILARYPDAKAAKVSFQQRSAGK